MKLLFLVVFSFLHLFLHSQEIKISNCQLEYTKSNIKNVKKTYYLAKEIFIDAKKNLLYKYRITLDINNLENKVNEAIVFRYSISIKVKKNSDMQGVWMIPFNIDEIRISKIQALSTKKVYLYNLNLQGQLNKLKNTKLDIEEVKLEIMKEPKKEDNKVEILSYIFPVKKL